MQLLIFIGIIILGGLLSLAIKPKARVIYAMAIGYIILAIIPSISTWIFYFVGIKDGPVLKMLSFIMSWGGMLGHLVLGYLIGSIATDSNPLRKMINAALWGISILTANAFLVATVGKSQHIEEMITFFKASGYAIWFLYFIMTAEALGGLGILLHFKLRTGPLAAAGLAIIMLGAVYTHWHNKDPFSDSYAPVGQLVNLSLMLILYYFEQQADRKHQPTIIYII
jgi:uncharacterized membrane protein YphA (DoxX/SURF4 family)